MGHAATKELLTARWAQLVNDPSLHDLPYKIELNREGTIEMSPANNRHGMRQGEIAMLLGNAPVECLSERSRLVHPARAGLPRLPEIRR